MSFARRVGYRHPAHLLVALVCACDAPSERVETWLLAPAADRAPAVWGMEPPIALEREAPLPPPSGELTLDEAQRRALRANPDIHAAVARLESAFARIGESQAAYYPNLSLTGNWSRTFLSPSLVGRITPPINPLPFLPFSPTQDTLNFASILSALSRPLLQTGGLGGGDSNGFSQNSFTFTATWTLFDGFVRRARLLATRANYSASKYERANVERLISSAVNAAYHQTQLGREQLRVAMADEAFSREQLSETEKMVRAGTAARDDVLNFQVRVLAAQAQVTASTGVRDMGRVLLAELLALPDVHWPEGLEVAALTEEQPEDLVEPEVGAWTERAIENRADLKAADYRLKSASENIRLARGQFSPTLNLSGSYGFEKRSTFELSEDDQTAAGGLEMRWQIFTGGFRTSQLRRAEAERREAAAQLERTRNAVLSEVQRAIIGLKDAQQQVALQRLTLEAATENRRIVQAQYVAGRATLVRLNEAQRDYVQADANLATARIRLRQAWSDLNTSAGSNDQ
ncbi:MAG TPA: TolC family protein [Phycisphaerae bacterium]|jgi:outer membrane protein TolC